MTRIFKLLALCCLTIAFLLPVQAQDHAHQLGQKVTQSGEKTTFPEQLSPEEYEAQKMERARQAILDAERAKMEERAANAPTGYLFPESQYCRLKASDVGTGNRYGPPEFIQRMISQGRDGGANCATINIEYFGTVSPQAQAAMRFAADIWEACLVDPVEINIAIGFADLGPGVLGAAGPVFLWHNPSEFGGGPFANSYYPDALADKLNNGDLNPADGVTDFTAFGFIPLDGHDFVAAFSTAFPFYFGTDANPPVGEFDFVSIAMHEIGHGLGFTGVATVAPGGEGFVRLGRFDPGVLPDDPAIYSQMMDNNGGTSILDPAFPEGSTALGDELTSGAGATGAGLYATSAGAIAGNGGNPVKLYTPTGWQGGSSYSHWNDATFDGTINSTMTHAIAPGEANHNPGPATLGLFEDMGWMIATGPCDNNMDNDLCEDAVPIECGQTLSGTTVGATTDDAVAPTCGTLVTSPGVWYSITGTGGMMTASVCDAADFDSKISIYTGPCDNLTCVDGNDDAPGCTGNTSEISWASMAGTNYYILVHGFAGQTGDFDLSITCEQVGPPNDDCDNAAPIACGDVVQGTTTGAGFDGAPFCGTANTAGGVWYSIVGTGDLVVLSTCNPGTGYDTKISVYSGTCGALVCETGNDDDLGGSPLFCSTAEFLSTPGVTYNILVHGFGTATGDFELSVECIPPPPNDLCEDAIRVRCGDTVMGDTRLATAAGAPATDCFDDPFSDDLGAGIWYTFHGTGDFVTLSTCGMANYDTKIDVFTGSCDALTCVAGNDDGLGCAGLTSEVGFQSVAGQTYYIYVSGFAITGLGTSVGQFTMTVDCKACDITDVFVDPFGQPACAEDLPAGITPPGTFAVCFGMFGITPFSAPAEGDIRVVVDGIDYPVIPGLSGFDNLPDGTRYFFVCVSGIPGLGQQDMDVFISVARGCTFTARDLLDAPECDQPCTGISREMNLITNGDFETGDLTGWMSESDGANTGFQVNDGTVGTTSPRGALPPISGSFDVFTDQSGPGSALVSQPFVVPVGIESAILNWSDRIHNFADVFEDPNQEFRVVLRDATQTPVAEIWSTNPGDALIQEGPNARSVNVTALLQAYEGQEVCIAFEQEDDLFFFNLTLDDISLDVEVCAQPCDITGMDLIRGPECLDNGKVGVCINVTGVSLPNEPGMLILNGRMADIVEFVPAADGSGALICFEVEADGRSYDVFYKAEDGCTFYRRGFFRAPDRCDGGGGGGDDDDDRCDITNIYDFETTCNGDGTYDLRFRIDFNDPPTTGRLAIEVGRDWYMRDIRTSPRRVRIRNLPADGRSQNVFVKFTDDNGCTFYRRNAFRAPSDCGTRRTDGLAQLSEQTINVYPNPSAGKFSIFAESLENTKLEAKVMNAVGQVVKTIELNTNEEVSVDLSGLPKGVYNIRIAEGENTFTKRVIIAE